jgi:Na+-driven multidrug efflux pump
VQQAAEAFVAIVTLSLPLHATNLVLYGFFVGILRTRVLFWYTALVATSNVLFNYCLILGHCGFARLGIRGAALSDLLAESAGCLFLMLYAHLCGAARQFGLFRFTRWRHPLNSVFRNLAAPSALKGLIECAAWMVFFGIFERRGPEALAAASVVYAVYIFLLIPSKGFSEVICATVSNLIGQGEEAKIRVAIGRTITLNFVNTGPFLIFAAVCPALAISVIGSEGAAIGDCIASLRILAIAMCAAIPAQIYANAVYGTGDSFSTLGIEALASVSLVAAAYCAAIVLKFPPAYTWCALGISWLVSLGLSSLWLQHGAWRRVKI